MIFSVFKKIEFWGILGPPSYGIGATIRIGREMLCLPYAGVLFEKKKLLHEHYSDNYPVTTKSSEKNYELSVYS